MKQKCIGLVPYLFVFVINFYVFPLLIKDTGTAIFLMLCVLPLVVFVSSLVYGIKHGFDFWLSAAAALLFLPSIFLFYNGTAWVYALIYGGIALAGAALGRIFQKK